MPLSYDWQDAAENETQTGLNGHLPILVFIKEFPQIQAINANQVAGTPAAERILSEYFKETGNGLDVELVKAFCAAGLVIFLIDGLDEITYELRGLVQFPGLFQKRLSMQQTGERQC